MNQPLSRKFVPVIGFFILANILIFIFIKFLRSAGFNISFLLGANAVLFLLSSFGFFIQTKGVKSTNTNAFIRSIYSALLMKLFVVVAAILIYVLILGGKVNIPSLFTAMVFYIIYTSIEVIQLMKLVRKKSDV
ncbi:MAG TPA: hypothetical protein VN722_10160 [Hanamia sp.]|nr:hypothetical protein [Hanamia sp.]